MGSWTRRDVPSTGSGPDAAALIVYDTESGQFWPLGAAGDEHLVVVAVPAASAVDDHATADWLVSADGDEAVRAGMPGYVLAEFARRPSLLQHGDVTPAVARALAAARVDAVA